MNRAPSILGEVDMTEAEARAAVDAIRHDIDTMIVRLNDLWSRRAWLALGYESWGDLCASEFPNRQLPRDRRGEAIGELRAAGMSTRAIGDALGVDDKTVRNDLAGAEFSAPDVIVGTDGKRYQTPTPDSDRAFADRIRNLDPDRVRSLLAEDEDDQPTWEPSTGNLAIDTLAVVVVGEIDYDDSPRVTAYGPFVSIDDAVSFADTISADVGPEGGYPPSVRVLTLGDLVTPQSADWLQGDFHVE